MIVTAGYRMTLQKGFCRVQSASIFAGKRGSFAPIVPKTLTHTVGLRLVSFSIICVRDAVDERAIVSALQTTVVENFRLMLSIVHFSVLFLSTLFSCF